jgi:glycosyltransferase involved in cell wall biosynthesis
MCETLSVVIPTKNAAGLLEGCLASVSWADEIIVVDMFSTDGTDEVCRRYEQCRLVEREDYIFGNVNHGIDIAQSDWVMRLDTDERITSELAAEIRSMLADPPDGVAGFEFWERPIILGHELRYGFGRRHYRRMMFRKGSARYPVRSEHEDLITSGVWRRMRHGYLHLNYATVGQYLSKTDYYTDRDLERTDVPERCPSVVTGMTSTARAFYLYYLKYQGVRDGWVGFVDAAMRGVYQLVWWAKLRHRWEQENTRE